MSNTVLFHKMVASGNDFIVIDNRKRVIKNPAAFAKKVCSLHTGVGADGILLYENSSKADFKMRIVNSDGSEAEACGNGFRCISLYAKEKMKMGSEFKFETLAGIISAKVRGTRVSVGMVRPKDLKLHGDLHVSGHRLHYSFINTGVPHTVILAEGLEKIDVNSLGREIRYHKDFKPKGTNVNFVEITGPKQIRVRTYERGVEKETLACGTGSTASAVITSLLDYTKSPVAVKTSGGEILNIDFKREGSSVTDVKLEGAVEFVFEGKLNQ